MSRKRRRVHGAVAAGVVAAAGVVYTATRPPGLRHFGVVRAGVLYRSGQLTPAGLERVLAEHACRTVVTRRPVRDAGANADT